VNLRSERQGEFEGRTLSCTGTLGSDCAAVQLHDFAYNCKPEAQTVVIRRGCAFVLAEPFENVRFEIVAHSLTRVRD
jgi:hypothetical protein